MQQAVRLRSVPGVCLLTLMLLAAPGVALPQSCGDPDGNGRIDVIDAANVAREAVGLPSICTPAVCNVDATGAVDVIDAANVAREAVGLPASVPCVEVAQFLIDVQDQSGNKGVLGLGFAPIPDASGPGMVAAAGATNAVARRTIPYDISVALGATAAQAAAGSSIIVAVRRANGTAVEGFFELSGVSTLVPARLVATTFPDELESIEFVLEFATRVDGQVGPYTQLNLSVGSPVSTTLELIQGLGVGAESVAAAEVMDSGDHPDHHSRARQAGQTLPEGGFVFPTVSSDGMDVYALPIDGPEGILAFRRDRDQGTLLFNELEPPGTQNPLLDLTLSPDGRHLYARQIQSLAPGSGENGIRLYNRFEDSGLLAFVGLLPTGVAAPFSLALSPDSRHAYVGSFGVIDLYSRDVETGILTFVDRTPIEVGSDVAAPIAVSPDGENVYAGVPNAEAIVALGRDPATGRLTFLGKQTEGAAGVEGLRRSQALAVSPNGNHIYSASTEDSIAIFARDDIEGGVAFVAALFEQVDGVDGLNQLRSLAMDADGSRVYAASQTPFSGAVAVFDRDLTTGMLTFNESQFDRVGGVEGLRGANSVVLSPEGDTVYVTSSPSGLEFIPTSEKRKIGAVLTFGTLR